MPRLNRKSPRLPQANPQGERPLEHPSQRETSLAIASRGNGNHANDSQTTSSQVIGSRAKRAKGRRVGVEDVDESPLVPIDLKRVNRSRVLNPEKPPTKVRRRKLAIRVVAGAANVPIAADSADLAVKADNRADNNPRARRDNGGSAGVKASARGASKPRSALAKKSRPKAC